ITGTDECATPFACSCVGSSPAISALAVPSGATEFVRASGATAPYDPSPLSQPAAATLMASLGIDWNAIINLNALPAGPVIPDSAWPGSSAWKITRVKTNPYTIPSDGNGILIVEGDLNFSGSRDFDGIILVGG